jgi:anaerobic magnesium-protoporphyrin IX monomethyl ester cyclase
MKITLLTPPALAGKLAADRVFGCNYGYYAVPNIFILTCAAVLEQEGYKVDYVDGAIEKWTRRDLVDYLKRDESDLYVFYTVYLAKETDLQTLGLIRELRGNVKVAFVGPVPTETPEKFLLDDNVYVVRGEPETTLKEFVGALRDHQPMDHVQSLSYRRNGQLQHNPMRRVIDDLDTLPLPARHLIDKNRYYNPKIGIRPFSVVLASRGCSYQCTYCVPCSLSFARELEYKAYLNRKPPVRQRSAQNVLEEVRMLKAEGYRSIGFIDDQFIWNEDRVIDLCEGLREIDIEWGCLARADRLNERIVRKFAESKCQYVDIGVESFNQEILDDLKKDLDVNTIYYAIDLLKKYRITAKINVLIAATPLETEETILENIRIIKKIRPDSVMYGITNPFPGTDFHKIAKREGWLLYDEYKPVDVQKECIISYPHLDNRKIEKLARKANLSFFLSPHFLLQNLKKIRTGGDFWRAYISFKRKLFD